MMQNSQYPVPPWMFGAVQNVESGGNPNAVSPAGAMGPMQVMPQTAADPGFGVMPARDNSPQELQRVGQDYLQAMNNRYQGNSQNALMAYNWGPGNVDKMLAGQPMQVPAETQAYVPKVMNQQPANIQYAQNNMQMNDASSQPSKMELMLEAEKRGILPQDKSALLAEARSRGLIAGEKQQTDPPSGIEDALKSFGGGLERGAAGTVMILPNMINAAVAGPQYLGKGISDTVMGNPTDKNFQPWQPFFSSEDVLKQLPEALQPHDPTTPIGVMANIGGQLAGGIGTAKKIQDIGSPSPEIPSPKEVRDASNNAYQQMRNAGATLNQSGIGRVTYSIGKSLDNTGLMNPALHGDTMSVVDQMNKDAASGSMDLEKLDQYRQLLNQVVSKNTSKIDGANPDAFKAQTAIHALDDAVDGLSAQHLSNGTPQAIEALNNGRALYSASARMSTMQNIVENANMTDNPATAIKTGFRNLAKQLRVNPRGYTPEEVDAINHAGQTGILTGALKTMGGKLMSGFAGGMGGAVGGGIPGGLLGAAVGEGVGFPMRAAANYLQGNRAQQAINMIGQRPIVQQVMGIQPPPQMPPFMPLMPGMIGNNAIQK